MCARSGPVCRPAGTSTRRSTCRLAVVPRSPKGSATSGNWRPGATIDAAPRTGGIRHRVPTGGQGRAPGPPGGPARGTGCACLFSFGQAAAGFRTARDTTGQITESLSASSSAGPLRPLCFVRRLRSDFAIMRLCCGLCLYRPRGARRNPIQPGQATVRITRSDENPGRPQARIPLAGRSPRKV
jgi:hypothetical protein